MVEKGEVKKTYKNGYCVVSFDRKTACDECHMCVVSKGGKKVELTVNNSAGASEGDTVDVTMADSAVLTSASIVYLIPLVLVALGVWLGGYFSEVTQIILATLGLILGFIIAVMIGRALKNKKGFMPVISKIYGEDDINMAASERCAGCLHTANCDKKNNGEACDYASRNNKEYKNE